MIYMTVMTAMAGLVPEGRLRYYAYSYVSIIAMRIVTRAWSCVITYHNRQYMAKSDGICVANHTTPIDVFFLNCDRAYALVFCERNHETNVIEAGGLFCQNLSTCIWSSKPRALSVNAM